MYLPMYVLEFKQKEEKKVCLNGLYETKILWP